MRIKRLGGTGLRVSEICLGAMTFGMPDWGCDEAESLRIIDRFLEAGGNFIDTADAYSAGRSEEICGVALRGRRSSLVLATKCTMPVGSGPNDRGASRKHIVESCDSSLRRLGTDYIDLYQVHVEDAATPVEETLSALDHLVRAGKVLYVGCSNYRAFRLAQALAISDRRGLARFVSFQPQYNLFERGIEREHVPLCVEEGVGIITWSPLAAGMLTGKFRPDHKPPEARLSQRRMPFYASYFTDHATAVIELLGRLAAQIGCTPAQLAIAWQLQKPAITAVIIGARSVAQADETLGATGVTVSAEVMAELDALTALPEEYPYNFIATVQQWLAL